MDKKYLYVAGDSFSAVGGNSIEEPHDETIIQHRRHMDGLPSLKPLELEQEMKKNNELFLIAQQKEEDSQWTNQLAKLLDLELIEDGGAIVGGSNERSVLKLKNFLLGDKRAKDSIVIWQWTTTERGLVFIREKAMWLTTKTSDLGFANKILYWKRKPDVAGYEQATRKLNQMSKSDFIDAYDLLEETKLLHSLSESVGAKFLAFDGMVNIEKYLETDNKEWDGKDKVFYKREEGDEDFIKNFVSQVTRCDRFHHPVLLDDDYHHIRINLFEELVKNNILIRPHGYTSWSEALKHHEDLDRENPQGAWVTPILKGKRLKKLEDRRRKCTYEEYLSDPYLIYGWRDSHPGHQARKLFAEFLAEKINDR